MDPVLDKGEEGVGLRPRFRADLVATPAEEEGVAYVDVVDPHNNAAFRFYDFEYAIAREMDGERTLAEIAAWAQARFGFETSPADLTGYAAKLEELGYLLSGGPIAAGVLPAGLSTQQDIPAAAEVPQDALELGAPGTPSAPPARATMRAVAPPPDLELGPPEAAQRPSRERMAAVAGPEEVGLETSGEVEVEASAVVDETTLVPPPVPADRVLAEQVHRAAGAHGGPPPVPRGPADAESLLKEIASQPSRPIAIPSEAASLIRGEDPALAATHLAMPAVPTVMPPPGPQLLSAASGGSFAETAAPGELPLLIRETPEDRVAMAALEAAASKKYTMPAKPVAKSSMAPWIWLGFALVLLASAGYVLLVHPELVGGGGGGKESTSQTGTGNGTGSGSAGSGGSGSSGSGATSSGGQPAALQPLSAPAALTAASSANLSFGAAGVIATVPPEGSDLAAGQVVAELQGAADLDAKAAADEDRANHYRYQLGVDQNAKPPNPTNVQHDNDKITEHTQSEAAEKAQALSLRIVAEQPVHVAKVLQAVGASVTAGEPVIEAGGGGPPAATFTVTVTPIPANLSVGAPCVVAKPTAPTVLIKGVVKAITGNQVQCGDFTDTTLQAGDQLELMPTAP
jgi:hypothetical protein